MSIQVRPTDAEWFRFLRARPHLDEVNFWIPSGAPVVTQPGERPAFESKAEAGNRSIGGAFVSGCTKLAVSEAWAFFGEGNGTADEDALRTKINRWRTKNGYPAQPDPQIGCLLLRDAFFVEDAAELDPRTGFPPEAVRGMSSAPDSAGYAEVDGLFVDLFWRSGITILRPGTDDVVRAVAGEVTRPTRGDPRLVVP